MNEPDSGQHKGARPKAKLTPAVSNGVEASCSDNNNSRRSLYCDETAANERLASGVDHSEHLSRPCGSGTQPMSRPLSLACTSELNARRRPHENGQSASSSQSIEAVLIPSSRLQRPSDLAVNGYCEKPVTSKSVNKNNETVVVSTNFETIDSEFSVLPRELLQDNADFCGLNGDCDLCGSRSVELEKCSLNSLERSANCLQESKDGACALGLFRHESHESGVSIISAQEDAPEVDESEGAVGGEEPQGKDLPGRCSPDSGEGEFENQNSRSPSCSWDQQSSSSSSAGEECFYRYRGEDDVPRNPAANENIPNRVDGQNDARRRSSSPEMDYLEMDFDPSSSDWGGDDARPAAPVAPLPPMLDPHPPTPPPLPVPQVHLPPSPREERPLTRPVQQQERPVLAAAVTRGDVMLWSQSCASELTHPFTTPLTSASNAIYYAMTALGHSISREGVVAHFTEAHPTHPVPQTVVGYLLHRASHTSPIPLSSFSQPALILTGPDLARALRVMSRGQLRARFFPIASRQLLESGSLCSYLTAWLHRGVVPILTFSQASSEGVRHEMVFGSTEGGILTMGEPYRTLTEAALSTRLAGQGRVAVPHSEILSRWGREQELRPLLQTPCLAWATQNILGSVVGMLREATVPSASPSPSSPCTSRQPQPQPLLSLPLLCESGVTLVCPSTNPCCHLLENCNTFNQ